MSAMGQRRNIRTRDAHSSLITQEIIRVSGALWQELGTKTNIYFLLSYSHLLVFIERELYSL